MQRRSAAAAAAAFPYQVIFAAGWELPVKQFSCSLSSCVCFFLSFVFYCFLSILGDFCCWVRFACSAVQLQPLKFCLFWGVLFLIAPIFVCLFACLVFFLLLFLSLPGDFCSWMGVACRAVQLQPLSNLCAHNLGTRAGVGSRQVESGAENSFLVAKRN